MKIKKFLLGTAKDVILKEGILVKFDSNIPFSEYKLFEVFAETTYISLSNVCTISAMERLTVAFGLDQNSTAFGILDFASQPSNTAIIRSLNTNLKANLIRIYGIKIKA